MSKPNIHRTILQLKAKEYITPNYIRLTLTGEDISVYDQCTVGANNKIFIPPKGVEEVYFTNFGISDPELLDKYAHRRTYTHAGIDVEKQEMYMDFVAHGVEGPASEYAMNAPIGAPLGVAMKITKMELVPSVDFYYLVGDATAIPVIRATLASINPTAKGKVFIEVPTQEDIQQLTKPEGIEIQWVINTKTAEDTILADKAIAYLNTVEGNQDTNRFAFVACEYSNVRKLRNYLRKEKNWAREEVSAYSYWKYGVAESKSEKERREEKNSI